VYLHKSSYAQVIREMRRLRGLEGKNELTLFWKRNSPYIDVRESVRVDILEFCTSPCTFCLSPATISKMLLRMLINVSVKLCAC